MAQAQTFKLRSTLGGTDSTGGLTEGAGSSSSSFPTSQSALEFGARSAALQGGLELIGEGIAGFAEFGAKIAETKEIRFAAKQENVKGKQEAVNLLEQLNDTQATNIVLAFAQGRQLTGSVVSIQQELGLKAAGAISVTKLNAKIKTLALTRRADQLEALAEWEKSVAPFKIITGLALSVAAFKL